MRPGFESLVIQNQKMQFVHDLVDTIGKDAIECVWYYGSFYGYDLKKIVYKKYF
jgi:nicotinamidase-related amidase